jgi:hypothetical protein
LIARDRDPVAERIGSRMAVEISYDRVDQFRSASEQGEDRFLPIPDTGDYAITGTIIQSWPDHVIVVQTHGIPVMVEVPGDSPVDMSTGTRVQFFLHGLSLWDINI